MTGQAERVSTVTPRRSFLAILSDLAGAEVESLADLLRTFNDQNGVQVAYKAFYNRLARLGFGTFIVVGACGPSSTCASRRSRRTPPRSGSWCRAGTQRENSSRWSPVHCASVPVPV